MSDIKIRQLFKKRIQRKFRTDTNPDGWILDILKSENNTECYINSQPLEDNGTITDIDKILQKGFYITAVFYCGNIYTNRKDEVCLFIFNRRKPDKIKLGYRELQSFDSKNKKKYQAEINTSDLPQEYRQYLYEAEEWINNDKYPKDFEKNHLWGEIAYEKYFPKINLNPLNYLQIANEKGDKVEKNAKLSDYAEIITPKQLKRFDPNDMHVKVLAAETYSKPFQFSDIGNTFRTDTQLQMDDILINDKNEIYIHKVKYKSPVYVSPNNQKLIRKKDGVDINALYCILKIDSELLYDDIAPDMPVIEIKKDVDYEKCYKILNGRVFEYESFDSADENLNLELKSCVIKQMQTVIQHDLQEIDSCYKSSAYKAAIILCGSVLEAFLYDWLKAENIEIDKKWDLKKYIEQINKKKGENWNDAAEKANEIRRKRNFVHPEKYLYSFSSFDKKLCDTIINSLKDVTSTRTKM